MRQAITRRFFLPVSYLMLTGCHIDSQAPPYRGAQDIIPAHHTAVGSRAGFCRVHHTPVNSRDGFTFGKNVSADPTWDYVRFMDEERFPNVTPWSFSSKRSDVVSEPTTVRYCPQCDAEFEEEFGKFRRLAEPQKQAAFEASLREEILRKKAEDAPLRAKPSPP
jgi:hypothetical protein